MKVLLTGATGFVGSHLLKELLQAQEVIILKRSFSKVANIEALLPKLKYYDLDKTLLRTIFQQNKIDAVIHTATSYGRQSGLTFQVWQANLLFPLELFYYSVKNRVKLFINTDTFFTKYRGYQYLRAYAGTKQLFKNILKYLTNKNTLYIKVVNICLEHVYGPQDGSQKFIPMLIDKLLNKAEQIQLSSCTQKRDFIYIEDVVKAYTQVLNNFTGLTNNYTEYELGSGKSVDLKKVIELLKKITENQTTKLNYGSLPSRKQEILDSKADLINKKLPGWTAQIVLEEGLTKAVAGYVPKK